VQVSLKDAIKAAVTALTRPDAMSAEDKAFLKQKWDNNTQKRPNAPQEVHCCVRAGLCLFKCSSFAALQLTVGFLWH